MRRYLATLFLLLPTTASAQTPPMPADYQAVLTSLAKQGDFKDNVLRVNVPRNDLHVVIDGVATPTPFGFGGWLGLTKGTGGMDVTGRPSTAATRTRSSPATSRCWIARSRRC